MDKGGQPSLFSFVSIAVSPLSPALAVGDRTGSFTGWTLLHPVDSWLQTIPREYNGMEVEGHCLLRSDRIDTSVFLVTEGSGRLSLSLSLCLCVCLYLNF